LVARLSDEVDRARHCDDAAIVASGKGRTGRDSKEDIVDVVGGVRCVSLRENGRSGRESGVEGRIGLVSAVKDLVARLEASSDTLHLAARNGEAPSASIGLGGKGSGAA